MIIIDDPRNNQFRESHNNIILFAINEFKTQIKEQKMSIGKWETDEFPQKLADSQDAIITNVETQLVNRVIEEIDKLEAIFLKIFLIYLHCIVNYL
jgi:hypothetical protein